MKTIKLLSLIGFLILMFASCAEDEDGGYYDNGFLSSNEVRNAVFRTALRFELPDGSNLLSAFSDLPQGSGYVSFPLDTIHWLDIKCVRADIAPTTMTYSSSLYYPDSETMRAACGEGPLLVINWLDMDFRSGMLKQTSDVRYYIFVSAHRFPNGGKVHTIIWDLHVEGSQYMVTRCEVDGMEYDFVNDDYYHLSNIQSGYVSSGGKPILNGLIHVDDSKIE